MKFILNGDEIECTPEEYLQLKKLYEKKVEPENIVPIITTKIEIPTEIVEKKEKKIYRHIKPEWKKIANNIEMQVCADNNFDFLGNMLIKVGAKSNKWAIEKMIQLLRKSKKVVIIKHDGFIFIKPTDLRCNTEDIKKRIYEIRGYKNRTMFSCTEDTLERIRTILKDKKEMPIKKIIEEINGVYKKHIAKHISQTIKSKPNCGIVYTLQRKKIGNLIHNFGMLHLNETPVSTKQIAKTETKTVHTMQTMIPKQQQFISKRKEYHLNNGCNEVEASMLAEQESKILKPVLEKKEKENSEIPKPLNLSPNHIYVYEESLKYMIANGGKMTYLNFGKTVGLVGLEWRAFCRSFASKSSEIAKYFGVEDYFVVDLHDGKYDYITYDKALRQQKEKKIQEALDYDVGIL